MTRWHRFAHRFREKGIDVNTRWPHRIASIPADPHQLARILRNLTDNAVRYTPQKRAAGYSGYRE